MAEAASSDSSSPKQSFFILPEDLLFRIFEYALPITRSPSDGTRSCGKSSQLISLMRINKTSCSLLEPLWQKRQEQIVMEPYSYIAQKPGKNIRTALILAFNQWLKIDEGKIHIISSMVEKFHNASLLIDDIEDNATLRRGLPVAHAVYGVPSTINSANYMYFYAVKMAESLQNPRVLSILTEEIMKLHIGQGLDIYWRDNFLCPTMEEYKDMVLGKTGGLFRMSVRLMQQFSSNTTDFLTLTNKMGLWFQILDDFLNLESSKYHQNKSFCEDLTEGKFSLPIIHHIHKAAAGDTRVLDILKQRTNDTDLKHAALDCLRETGSLEYTRAIIARLSAELRGLINSLGGNPRLVQALNDLEALMG